MSKDMNGMEKLVFMGSVIWVMHWGVRLAQQVVSYALS